MSNYDVVCDALADLEVRIAKHGRSKQTERDWLSHWRKREPDIAGILLMHLRVSELGNENNRQPPKSRFSLSWLLAFLPDLIGSITFVALAFAVLQYPDSVALWLVVAVLVCFAVAQLLRRYFSKWVGFVFVGNGTVLIGSVGLPSLSARVNFDEWGWLEVVPLSLGESAIRTAAGIVLLLAGGLALRN